MKLLPMMSLKKLIKTNYLGVAVSAGPALEPVYVAAGVQRYVRRQARRPPERITRCCLAWCRKQLSPPCPAVGGFAPPPRARVSLAPRRAPAGQA